VSAGEACEAFAGVAPKSVQSLHVFDRLQDEFASICSSACQFPNLVDLQIYPSSWKGFKRQQGPCGGTALAHLVSSRVRLQRFNLGVDLGPEMTALVLGALQGHSQLKKLRLSWMRLSCPDSFELLRSLLRKQSHLECFRLEHTIGSLTLTQLRELTASARCSGKTLQTLSLVNVGANTSDSLSPVSKMLSETQQLRKLNLSYCTVFDSGNMPLRNTFAFPLSLRVLKLMSCNLNTQVSLECVAEALRHAIELQELNLRSNLMPPNGLRTLLTALTHTRSFRELDLFDCELCDPTTSTLCTFFQDHETIQSVHLGNNRFLDASLEDMLQVFLLLPELREVIAGHNKPLFAPSEATRGAFIDALGLRDNGGCVAFLNVRDS
jgi:hypothetical protein